MIAASPPPAAPPAPLVRMRGITKRFLGVAANRDIHLDLFPGEVCALLGENGAGKSTLMNVLFGYYACDAGDIQVAGRPLPPGAPRAALAAGIRMIHQHFALAPALTVLENVMAGQEGGRFRLDRHAARARLAQLQAQYGLAVNPDARVAALAVGEQQRVEILKALYGDVRVLIMDEPTAVLTPPEVDQLLAMLRSFARDGRAVVFISHKLNEVLRVADRVVVLRNGAVAAARATAGADAAELARLMVGHALAAPRPKPAAVPGPVLLRVDDLTVPNDRGLPAVRQVSFAVAAGEILGLAGVSGSGQRELAEALFGIRAPAHGQVAIAGQPVRPGRPRAVVAAGMARIPEDRLATGLMAELSVEDNLVLETYAAPPYAAWRLLRHDRVRAAAQRLMAEYHIKASGPAAPVRTLSGGNMQKVILARELSSRPRVILAAQPTRGLDVGATEDIHARLLAERARGTAILLISEDLDEIQALSDRIMVFYEGRIMGEMAAAGADRARLGLWMSGVAA